jgi:molecular chaperone GrpE
MSKKKNNTVEKEQEVAQQETVKDEATTTEETTEATETTEEVSVEEQLQGEIAKEKDKFLRLFAEFENYKRRTAKERMELFKTAGKDVVVAMLPVLDDFDRALTEISKTEEEELKKGVLLICFNSIVALKTKGIGEFEV